MKKTKRMILPILLSIAGITNTSSYWDWGYWPPSLQSAWDRTKTTTQQTFSPAWGWVQQHPKTATATLGGLGTLGLIYWYLMQDALNSVKALLRNEYFITD